jgi:hypothetical protein
MRNDKLNRLWKKTKALQKKAKSGKLRGHEAALLRRYEGSFRKQARYIEDDNAQGYEDV